MIRYVWVGTMFELVSMEFNIGTFRKMTFFLGILAFNLFWLNLNIEHAERWTWIKRKMKIWIQRTFPVFLWKSLSATDSLTWVRWCSLTFRSSNMRKKTLAKLNYGKTCIKWTLSQTNLNIWNRFSICQWRPNRPFGIFIAFKFRCHMNLIFVRKRKLKAT